MQSLEKFPQHEMQMGGKSHWGKGFPNPKALGSACIITCMREGTD